MQAKKNAMIANSAFSDKKPHLQASGFLLTSEVANYDDWGTAEINRRLDVENAGRRFQRFLVTPQVAQRPALVVPSILVSGIDGCNTVVCLQGFLRPPQLV